MSLTFFLLVSNFLIITFPNFFALFIGPAPADAGTNARPKRGVLLSSDFMTSSGSVNRVTIVVERKYAVLH